jgi:hypothetical protein
LVIPLAFEPLLDWLSAPLSGADTHTIETVVYWHARLMVLAWGVLLPMGVLAARFFKVLPGQDWPRVLDAKPWWHAHRALQWSGLLLMTLAIGLVLTREGTSGVGPAALAHAWLGWSLAAAGWLQVAAAQARGTKGGPTAPTMRGDHYDMTTRRVRFEQLHKALGWLAMLASVACIVLGLVVADAPRWMLLTLGLWWMVLVGAFVVLQRAGRCVDTYQAIWGPDPVHPGNRRSPVGWGVRRPLG